MWHHQPTWPKDDIKIPEDILPFQDVKFGPMIDIFPRVFKNGKGNSLPSVFLVMDCGDQERNGKQIKLMRMDRYLPMNDPRVSFMFYVGIGHFKGNNYRQRSPYIFHYDDKLWARIATPGYKGLWSRKRKERYHRSITWMVGTSGMRFSHRSYLDDVYTGLYPIEVTDDPKPILERRLGYCYECLTKYEPKR